MSTQPLERAIVASRSLLANVNAEQLANRTPCEAWDVAGLINHMIGALDFFGSVVTTSTSPDAIENPAAGDFLAAFDAAASRAVASLGAPGVAESMVELPFATVPGSVVANFAATDCFTHGWDLARATQQSTDLDSELAEQLLAGARIGVPESFRGPEGAPFGLIQTAGLGATNADHLAAFLGRVV